MAVAVESFYQNNRHPYRIPMGLALALFILSLVFHGSLLLIASRKKDPGAPVIESRRVDVDLRYRPAVDTLQETAKEKPKAARFESARNLQAKEDTSPERAATSEAQSRGREDKSKASRVQKKSVPSQKIMSFTQEDLIAKGEIQNETLRGHRDNLDSTGFYEKLKRGAELKISALESDYGQYVTRMKRKISQQWNPQRTISAQMYSNNEVRVDVALLLNEKGELVDLKIINESFFPDYDAETKRAIRDAAPFPNPPKSLVQPEDHIIYMPWSFTVYMRQAGGFHVE